MVPAAGFKGAAGRHCNAQTGRRCWGGGSHCTLSCGVEDRGVEAVRSEFTPRTVDILHPDAAHRGRDSGLLNIIRHPHTANL